MAQVQISNKLNQEISIYDSFGKDSNVPYYGNLTLMGKVAANGEVVLTLSHESVDVLIAFDSNNAPVARYQWNATHEDKPGPFILTSKDVDRIQKSEQFVLEIIKNKSSSLAVNFQNAQKKGPDAVNTFFGDTQQYKQCTFVSYMLALTYEAQTAASKNQPPDKKNYSLSKLIEILSGLPYPDGLPDIEVSNFFCQYVNEVLKFGCQVNLAHLLFAWIWIVINGFITCMCFALPHLFNHY